MIHTRPEWIDRLAGVLVDNACRYSPDGGTVEVTVVTSEGRLRLAVDDSVKQDGSRRVVEVVSVVRRDLKIPFQLSGIRIERDDGLGP